MCKKSTHQFTSEYLQKCAVHLFIAVALSFVAFGSFATAQSMEQIEHILSQPNSPDLLEEVDFILNNLDASTPVSIRIDLESWKLQAIPDEETQRSADYARGLYDKYTREDYSSDIQYGKTIHEMVQAFAKTQNINLAYEIVQDLRESVYAKPSIYLEYVIDLCLMEIYIETFDYQNALDVEISMLNNASYNTLPIFRGRKQSLLNEVAFLYNRIGNGEKALEYLEKAKAEYENKTHHPSDPEKLIATNKGNRGRAYLLLGRNKEAEKMGQDILATGRKRQEAYMMTLGYRLIGRAAYNLREHKRAHTVLKQGIRLADKIDITMMQKSLYADFALSLEALGLYKEALVWTRKQTELEIQAQRSVASARSSVYEAEERARASHNEILELKSQSRFMRAIITSLLCVGLIFILLIRSLLKNRKNLLLSQKKLVESEKKAQNANRAKSDFLANMSHEIRTPLNGVLGMLDLLRRTELNEQQMFYTDIIRKSGTNLLVVLSDILNLSKIEAGKTTIKSEPCDLKEVIGDVVTLFNASANEKQLTVGYHYDSGLPEKFVTDINAIRKVVSNLVGNAIKFTSKGGVFVQVTGEIIGNVTNVEISVKDTGIGIEKDKIELIFEEFAQAENSTTRKFGGTGLGLTISRKVVNLLGGQISVCSSVGEGTEFKVKLPLNIIQTPLKAVPQIPNNVLAQSYPAHDIKKVAV